jgi:hypothetical protein
VTEIAASVFVKVAFELLPVVAVITDLFTIHADREELFKDPDLTRIL